MLYRRLTLDEFEALEQQFIQFLAVNSVTAQDWEKIKATNLNRMNQLLDEFSDVVFSSVIEKAEYLVKASANEIIAFYCQTNDMTIVGITTAPEGNFHTFQNLQEAFDTLPDHSKIETFTQTIPYYTPRDKEVFKLLESGARLSNETIFNQIKALGK